VKSPYDFGARDDPNRLYVAANTLALQGWLNAIAGAAGEGRAGTFYVDKMLVARAGTTIDGAGTGFKIKAAKGLPAQLFANAGQIAVYGTCFEGITDKPQSVEMCAWNGINGPVHLEGNLFKSWRRFLTTFANCDNATVKGNEFVDWGSADPVPNPGACQYDGGYATWWGPNNTNANILDNNFHDGLWHAILIEAPHSRISRNRFLNTQEGAIFTGNGISHLTIDGNFIRNVVQRDCTACGIEFFGDHSRIINNDIENTGDASIMTTDTSHTLISGNTCGLSHQTDPADPNNAVVTVRTISNQYWPHNLTIVDNDLSADDHKAGHAIGFYDFGMGGRSCDDVLVTDNMIGVDWRLGQIQYFGNVKGQRFVVQQ
jgi:hypothetical protein